MSTVAHLTLSHPGRHTAVWFATAYSPRVLASLAASLRILRLCYYPLPVDAPGLGWSYQTGNVSLTGNHFLACHVDFVAFTPYLLTGQLLVPCQRQAYV